MTPHTDTPAPTDQPRNETVLLVDDYNPGRPALRDYLRKAGFTVLDANSAAEAYQACDRHAGPVHLLITDVRVSALSQPELAPTLRTRYPGLKVLYISGFAPSELEEQGFLTGGQDFLQKAFSPKRLVDKACEILDQPQPPPSPAPPP